MKRTENTPTAPLVGPSTAGMTGDGAEAAGRRWYEEVTKEVRVPSPPFRGVRGSDAEKEAVRVEGIAKITDALAKMDYDDVNNLSIAADAIRNYDGNTHTAEHLILELLRLYASGDLTPDRVAGASQEFSENHKFALGVTKRLLAMSPDALGIPTAWQRRTA